MSTPTFAPAPDGEALVIRYLTGRGFRVSSALPAAPTFPYLTLGRVGGYDDRWADHPRIQLDSWANTKADARDYLARALAAVWELPWKNTDPGVEVTEASPDGGTTTMWLPDDSVQPPRPRYLSGFYLTVRPK